MEQNKFNEFKDPYFEDIQAKTGFSFDFVLWFYRILKYWYLFVISLILLLGYAYIKNKSWVPAYVSRATVMIEPRGNTISVAMSTVSYSNIRNLNNQQTVLQSRKLTIDAIEKLPQLQVKYFKRTRFKTENLYGRTPIVIDCNYIAPSAYYYDYYIEPIDSEKCRISYKETENSPSFSMEIPYGQFVQESRFFIKIRKTERFSSNFQPFNFRFVTKDELVNYYTGRVMAGAQGSTGSSAITVSVVGESPNQDVQFLAKLLEEFKNNNLMLKNEASDNTIRFIDHQLAIITDSLHSSENTFKNFQDETGIYSVESENDRTKKREITSSLAEIRVKERLILQLTDTIRNTIVYDEELVDPSSLGLDITQGDGSLSAFVKDYNTIIRTLQEMGKANPMYAQNEKKVLGLKIKILEGLKSLQAKVQTDKETISERLLDIDQNLSVLPAKEREFLRYQQLYDVNDKYSTYLMQKRYEARIQKSSNVPDNYILEPPKQEGGPINGNQRTDTYMICLIIGLALPLIFVICKEEFFNFSISTKEECERISGMPVIGAIENVSKKMTNANGAKFLVKNLPKSSFAESFRNMRIRIEYMAQKESPICLLVTSAEPADGKTFVASNMASIYQLTGKRVILVDFDLRRPSVAKNLGVQSKKGVSNFLIGQVTLEEITLTHPEYGFDIITAGTLPPNPSELIKTQKTKDLVAFLSANYDYVIMDCSPVGLVSDAYILSKMVDATLFVVRRGKTNKSFFKSVVTQVRNDGLENFALIFNDVKGREGYYGTSRYYGDKSYYLKRNSYYHDDYFEK